MRILYWWLRSLWLLLLYWLLHWLRYWHRYWLLRLLGVGSLVDRLQLYSLRGLLLLRLLSNDRKRSVGFICVEVESTITALSYVVNLGS